MPKIILKEIADEELDNYFEDRSKEITGKEIDYIIEKEFSDIPGEEPCNCSIEIDCDQVIFESKKRKSPDDNHPKSRKERTRIIGLNSIRKVRIEEPFDKEKDWKEKMKEMAKKMKETKKTERESRPEFSFWSLFRKK